MYRIAEILEVCDTPKIYSIGKSRTNKGLKLRHGHQERVFRIEFVSNNSFTDMEFDKWRETVMVGGMVLPTTRCDFFILNIYVNKRRKPLLPPPSCWNRLILM